MKKKWNKRNRNRESPSKKIRDPLLGEIIWETLLQTMDNSYTSMLVCETYLVRPNFDSNLLLKSESVLSSLLCRIRRGIRINAGDWRIHIGCCSAHGFLTIERIVRHFFSCQKLFGNVDKVCWKHWTFSNSRHSYGTDVHLRADRIEGECT